MNPPGRLVDLDTHRLHLLCSGEGGPAVVFDAALGASSVSWSLVQPGVARETRACAYDRAGFAWSDAGPLPRTAGRLAAELKTLLARAAVPPPYVLVGHSFGGLVTQVFAARFPGETAGLVLVDPAHPEDWMRPSEADRRKIERGVRLCRHGHAAARLGVARAVSWLVALGALAPARALVRLASRGGLQRQDEAILAPVWKLPPELRRPLRTLLDPAEVLRGARQPDRARLRQRGGGLGRAIRGIRRSPARGAVAERSRARPAGAPGGARPAVERRPPSHRQDPWTLAAPRRSSDGDRCRARRGTRGARPNGVQLG